MLNNSSRQDSVCQGQQNSTLNGGLPTATTTGNQEAVAGYTAKWLLPAVCIDVSGSLSSSDSVAAPPAAVELDDCSCHDVTRKQDAIVTTLAKKAAGEIGRVSTIAGCDALRIAGSGPSFTSLCHSSLPGTDRHQHQQQEPQQLPCQHHTSASIDSHLPLDSRGEYVQEAAAFDAVTQRSLDLHTTQRMQHRQLSTASSPVGMVTLPASLSNWGSVLLERDSSVKPSISTNAQGQSSFTTRSPLSIAGSGPADSGSVDCASGFSSRCSSSGSELVRSNTAIHAGLTPAVTPNDSPVGQLHVVSRASHTALASQASNIAAGKAPMPPQSPNPHGQLQAAVASSAVTSGAAVACQAPPTAATCPSPRAGMLLKQLSKAGGSRCPSGSWVQQAFSPEASPAKEFIGQDDYKTQMVDQHTADSNSRMAYARPQSLQDRQQLQPATDELPSALESLMKSRRVYRDISPKLDKLQEQVSRHGSWQLSGQYAVSTSASGQLLQQLQDSIVSKPVADDGESVVGGHSSGAHLHNSRSASLLRSPLVSSMSPAPPQVPPSPAQQHAAELRSNRRVSSNSIPSPSVSGHLTETGWLHKQASGVTQQHHAVQTASGSFATGAAPVAELSLTADSTSRWIVRVDAAQCDLEPQQDEHGRPLTANSFQVKPDPSLVDRNVGLQSDELVPMFTSYTHRKHPNKLSEQVADQGLVSIIAAGGGLALSLADGQQHRLQNAIHSKPPLYHAHLQQQDVPGTPGSLSRSISGITQCDMQMQQEVAVQHGSKPLNMQSMDSAQQYPVPPRRHVPVCRSPSVAMRTVTASPATAPANLHMQCHTPCSPVAEHAPNSNSSSSNTQQLWQMGSASFVPSVSSRGGTPVTTPLSSGRNSLLFAATGSGRSNMLLPLPAFEQLNMGGLGKSTSGVAWLADTAEATQHSQSSSLTSPSPTVHRHTSMPLSTGTDNSLDNTVVRYNRTSVSGGFLQQQQQQQDFQQCNVSLTPHPPSSHRPAPLMSPKAGLVLPHAHPHSSHMTASPSTKGRLAGRQRQDVCSSSVGGVQQMMQTLLETPRSSSAQCSAASAMAGPFISTGSGVLHAQAPAVVEPQQSSPMTAVSSEPALPSADRSCTSVEPSAPPLLTLPGIGELDSAGGSVCTTPNMDWGDQPDNQPGMDVRSDIYDVQSDTQPAGQPCDKPSLSLRDSSLHVKKSASSPKAAASSCRGTAFDSRRQGHLEGSVHSDAVSRSETSAGCPGWRSPVLVAYAHYKGRLGYLMSSGVVGVVYEDSSHMITRVGDKWACYHEHTTKPSAPASKSSVEADVYQQRHRWHDPTMPKDQDSARHFYGGSHDTAKQLGAAPLESGGLDLDVESLLFMLHAAEPETAGDYSRVGGSTNKLGGDDITVIDRVPEHLEAKARCLRRFVGYLVYNQPYSSHGQPDLTRLPFPITSESLQQAAASGEPLHAGVLHLRRFVLMDGCLLLKLTDGSWELVFLSDNSVLLLDAHCQQLAYVSCNRVPGASKAFDAGESSSAARSIVSSYVTSLIDAAAVPPDAKLLSRLVFASKLIKTLRIPDEWLRGHAAGVAAGS